MIDVQNLINNIKTITTKPLCTWGEFLTFLSTELQNIKERIGIPVNPPSVVLPDGVTTTTLISQSEMTQFVTNTLNVWQAGIPTTQGYNLNSLCYPELKKGVFNSETGVISAYNSDPYSVVFYSNYHNLINSVFNPSSYGRTELTYYDKTSGKITANSKIQETQVPLPFMFPSVGGYRLSIRFLTESLANDYSNIEQIWRRDYMTIVYSGMYPVSDGSIGTLFNIQWDRISSDQVRNCNKALICFDSKYRYAAGNESDSNMIPLFEISQEQPWYTSGSTYYVTVPLYAQYPKSEFE